MKLPKVKPPDSDHIVKKEGKPAKKTASIRPVAVMERVRQGRARCVVSSMKQQVHGGSGTTYVRYVMDSYECEHRMPGAGGAVAAGAQ